MPVKKRLANRLSFLEPSGIRKVFEIANQNPQLINFSIGEPDFDIPEYLKNEGIKAIQGGYNRYTPTKGIPELRKVICQQLERRGIKYEDILVTAGATGALLLSVLALADIGDHVLVPDPYFVAYRNIVYMAGAEPRTVDLYPDFQLTAEGVRKALTAKTRALIINSPNNPTGMVYHSAELQKIAELSEQAGFCIISDEVYEPFVYTNDFMSLGQISAQALVINSFSKSAAMTGWRLGYVSGPKEILDNMAMLQQYAYASTNSIAQRTAIKAFDMDFAPFRLDYQKKRDFAYSRLKNKFNVQKPEGGFYIFPQAPHGTASEFFQRAMEAGVLVIPGKDFSKQDTHFRISFAVDDLILQKGIEILCSIV